MTSTPPAANIGELRRALLAHYDRHRRRLPWRDEHDPYRILVSEVMLQQTRVETVMGFYGAWLERFPSLEALAAADEDEVLEAWAGLGYYRRARSLHRAARIARERPGGLPRTFEELRALPGLGDYTAGAVASIAFGERVPAADGNVRRVLARLKDVGAPTPAWVRQTAAELVDPERPGDWNQAMMELGATVCLPRRPRCDACPLAGWCAARARGTQDLRPGRTKRATPRSGRFALAVLHDAAGSVLLVRRPAGGLLGGLWAFPEREVAPGGRRDDGAGSGAAEMESATVGEQAARAALEAARELGVQVRGGPQALPRVVHRFTHLHAEYLPFALAAERAGGESGDGRAWVRASAEPDRALPTAQRRVLASFVAWQRAREVERADGAPV